MAAIKSTFTKKNPNLTGMVFHRLTVVEWVGKDKFGKRIWRCQCQCGKEVTTSSGSLIKGNTKSCGCLKIERITNLNRTHGASNTKEYLAWTAFINRCENPNSRDAKWYYDKGIKVHPDFRNSFECFINHIGHMPVPKMTVERIDGSKGYEPGNIRWATIKEQQRNRSNNHKIEYQGETRCLSEWAEIYNVPQRMLWQRLIKLGWGFEEAVSLPPRSVRHKKH